jgi:hypothetical protein
MKRYLDIVLFGLVVVWLLATFNLVYDNYGLQKGKLRVESKLRKCMYDLEEGKSELEKRKLETKYLLVEIKNLVVSKE